MTLLRLRILLLGLVGLAVFLLPALRADAKNKCTFDDENDASVYKYAVKVDGVEVASDDPTSLAWNNRGYVAVRRYEDSEQISEVWALFDLPEEDDLIEARGPVEVE